MLKICEYCGKEFQTSHSDSKFCSKECANKAKIGKPSWNKGTGKKTYAICKNCGKEFLMTHKAQKYCCTQCANEAHKGQPNLKNQVELVKVVCAECGKIEYVLPSRAKKYVCCSAKCKNIYYAKKQNQRIEKECPICGTKFWVKASKANRTKTCGKKECASKWRSQIHTGSTNPNYKTVQDRIKEQSIKAKNCHDPSKKIYQALVRDQFGLTSIAKLPKNYITHHKDCNHENNDIHNLVLLPRAAHSILHRWFGNILINALHTGKITRDAFFALCNKEQADFYKQIIDLDITKQVVLKQGELLESPEEDNQQPSIYRNIIEGSTTNSRVQTDNAEDSNTDTSALPIKDGDDIV